MLVANPLATALSPRLRPGGNRLRDLFLDPAEQALFSDWERAAEALLAGFRQAVGTDVDDPRFIELVGQLSIASPHFCRLWARHDVGPRRGARLTIDHPQVGKIHLDREKLGVTGTDGAMLVIYHPEPGTDSADKLALLAALSTAPKPAPGAAQPDVASATTAQRDTGQYPIAERVRSVRLRLGDDPGARPQPCR